MGSFFIFAIIRFYLYLLIFIDGFADYYVDFFLIGESVEIFEINSLFYNWICILSWFVSYIFLNLFTLEYVG
jgi:hypothetical protein